MGHGPAVKLGKDYASSYKTKLGIRMFIAYTIVWARPWPSSTVSV
jgi:hypothetical protein